ncbi:MAG: hypothetical protein BAJALOKI1v1_510008 [Promethearchaeota archaeon]|nr:MAG: hypothetical protein BAJALOKI1v1_510008 [Candidatus Lokiarchaeota archaeon]
MNKKNTIVAITLIFGISFTGIILGIYLIRVDEENPANLGALALLNQPPPYERVLLDRFPLSLDDLFLVNEPSAQQQVLNSIGNGSWWAANYFMVPYPFHFHLDHAPGAAKWYLYEDAHLNVSLPVDAYMEITDEDSPEIKTINGSLIQMDLGVNMHISYYITIKLGHICVNKSLVDAYKAAGMVNAFGRNLKAVFIPGNTTIGFTSNETHALDFLVEDRHEPNYPLRSGLSGIVNFNKNPYFYFTQSAQNEIKSYYQIQYDRMKLSGMYPEAELNQTFNINEANTLFGTWYYKEGNLELNESHHGDFWYRFDGAILNMLNVNSTSDETFYKDINKNANFTEDPTMIGVYGDSDYVNVEDYDLIGVRYMYLVNGSLDEGILNLTELADNVRSGEIYMKFRLISSLSSIYDDILWVEYFDALNSAEGSFSTNKSVYQRFYEH